jgi:guanylate kinase
VHDIHKKGKVCLLDVDINGVQQLKSCQFPAKYIFIKPPSMAALEQRLRGRASETEKQIQLRIANARKDLEFWELENDQFDYMITNNDVLTCVNQIETCLIKWFPQIFQKKSSIPK